MDVYGEIAFYRISWAIVVNRVCCRVIKCSPWKHKILYDFFPTTEYPYLFTVEMYIFSVQKKEKEMFSLDYKIML